MRGATAALVVLVLGGFWFAMALGRGGGWTSMTPMKSQIVYDRDARAVRQESITVENQEGQSSTYFLTVLGPVDRVATPWLEVEADFDGLTLIAVDGRTWTLAPEVGAVTWNSAEDEWESATIEFPPLEPPSFVDGGDLPEWLTERFPEGAEVVDRAFSPGGSREEAPR